MRRVIFLFIFLFSLINFCPAQSNGFVFLSESKYFNIYSQGEQDLLKLIRRLDIRSEYLSLKSVSPSQKRPQDILGEIFDVIFLEAQDILRMYPYNFKGNIKLCQNQRELNNFSRQFSGQNLSSSSFYIYNKNSIYINIQDICPESLAYEIACAIISHYFAVLPPKDVQDILAKDVGNRIKRLAR